MTRASFQSLGISPDCNDWVKMYARDGAILGADSLKSLQSNPKKSSLLFCGSFLSLHDASISVIAVNVN